MRELAHQPGADERLRELALFAGAGGGILGGHILGWRTVCAVEWDAYAIAVLCARQNDGVLPPFPIWDDIRSFNGRPWRGRVDVISGGFPCQDISSAGKGAGITGAKSGLWSEMARIVGEVRPRFVFVENSPNLVGRGLAVVLGDLASLGYDARWCVLGADDVGAPHRRKRIWIVANARSGRCGEPGCGEDQQSRGAEVVGAGDDADSHGIGLGAEKHEVRAGRDAAFDGGQDDADALCRGREHGRSKSTFIDHRPAHAAASRAWWPEPAVDRVAYGVPDRVDRIVCLGNAQVPAVAALAWRILTAREGGDESKEEGK